MIGAIAVGLVVAADGLMFYTLAELFAAGYDPAVRHAVHGPVFVAVALIAYGHLRLGAWYGLGRKTTLILATAIPFVILYGTLRAEIAGDLRIWDFGWVGDFLGGRDKRPEQSGAALTGAALLVGLWIKSAARAGNDTDLETIPKSLAIPFAVVTLTLIGGALTDRTGIVGRAGASFYATGVLALCLSQLAQGGATIGGLRAGSITGTLIGGTVAVVITALVALTVIFRVLGPLLGPPLEVIVATVLTVVLTPPAWLLEQFFRLIFRGSDPAFMTAPNDALQSLKSSTENGPESSDGPGLAALKVLGRMAALVLALAIAAGGIALVTRFRSRMTPAERTAASVSAGGIGEDVGSWLRSLRPGAKRRSAGGDANGGVVALYQAVLAEAERRGHPRGEDATPREFSPELVQVFDRSLAEPITTTFEEARYGGRPPDGALLDELQRKWKDAQRGP